MESKAGDLRIEGKINGFDANVLFIFLNTAKLSDCQKKTYKGFLEKQDSILPEIIDRIFENYKIAYPYFKRGWMISGEMSEKELEKYLPVPVTAENLKPLLKPSIVYFEDASKCKIGTFDFEFSCPWDIEHGVEIHIKDWKVSGPDYSKEKF